MDKKNKKLTLSLIVTLSTFIALALLLTYGQSVDAEKISDTAAHSQTYTLDQIDEMMVKSLTDGSPSILTPSIKSMSDVEKEKILQWVEEFLLSSNRVLIDVMEEKDGCNIFVAIVPETRELSFIILNSEHYKHTFQLGIDGEEKFKLDQEIYSIKKEMEDKKDTSPDGVSPHNERSAAVPFKSDVSDNNKNLSDGEVVDVDIVLEHNSKLGDGLDSAVVDVPADGVAVVTFSPVDDEDTNILIADGTINIYDGYAIRIIKEREIRYSVNKNTRIKANGTEVRIILSNSSPQDISKIEANASKLYIDGSGTLNVTTDEPYAVSGNSIIFVNTPVINAVGCHTGIYSKKELTIESSANITAEGGVYGIHSELYFDINGAKVCGTGGKYGVLVTQYINVHGAGASLKGKGSSGGIKTENGYISSGLGTEIFGEGYGSDGIGIESASLQGDMYIKADGSSITGEGQISGIVCRSNGQINSVGNAKIIGTATGTDGIGIEASSGSITSNGTESEIIAKGDKHGILTITSSIYANGGSYIEATSNQLSKGNAAIRCGGTITADGDSKIHEIYENGGVVYTSDPTNFTTDQPYITAIGRNMYDMKNYTWTDSEDSFITSTNGKYVQYSKGKNGLIAVSQISDIEVRGTRVGNHSSEKVGLLTSNSTHMITIKQNATKSNATVDIIVSMWDIYFTNSPEYITSTKSEYKIYDVGAHFVLNSNSAGFNTRNLETDKNGDLDIANLKEGEYTLSGGKLDGYKDISEIKFTVSEDMQIDITSGSAEMFGENGQKNDMRLKYSPDLIEYKISILDRYLFTKHNERKYIGGNVEIGAKLWLGNHGRYTDDLNITYRLSLNDKDKGSIIELHPRLIDWSLLQSKEGQNPKYYTIFDVKSTNFQMSNMDKGYNISDIKETDNVHIDTKNNEIIITNDYEKQTVLLDLQSNGSKDSKGLVAKYKYYPKGRLDEAEEIETTKKGYVKLNIRPDTEYILVQTSAPKGHALNSIQYNFKLGYNDHEKGGQNEYGFIINNANVGKQGWIKSFTDNPDEVYSKQKHYINLGYSTGNITVNVDATDVWFFHSSPTFIVALEGSDNDGNSRVFYKTVTVSDGIKDKKEFLSNLGKNICSGSVTFENIPTGTYILKVYSSSRYIGQDKEESVEIVESASSQRNYTFQNTNLQGYSGSDVVEYKFSIK